MPLHLLGKKSWNVYNQDNIDRVRRDEAAAEAREEAEEQAMQEVDAQRRMKMLRGEPVEDEPPLRKLTPSPRSKPGKEDPRLGIDTKYTDRDRKRKRLRGEDDTDRDMRYAKRIVEDRPSDDERRIARATKIDDATELVDHEGHINLFPEEFRALSRGARGTKDDERHPAKKEELVDVIRLSDAAGRSKGEKNSNPWYSSARRGESHDNDQIERTKKDVWGNEDPKRGARDQARMAADDPLAAMMKGVKQVRKVEADRKRWRDEREAEMRSFKDEDERRRRRRHRDHRRDRGSRGEHHDDQDDFDSFSLDAKGHEERPRRHDAGGHKHHRKQRSSDRAHSRRRDGDRG